MNSFTGHFPGISGDKTVEKEDKERKMVGEVNSTLVLLPPFFLSKTFETTNPKETRINVLWVKGRNEETVVD